MRLSITVSAASVPDVLLPCSLTVELKHDGKSISSARETIYHVADMVINNGNMELEFTGEFSGSNTDLSTIATISGNQALAKSLLTYVGANGIQPKSGNSQVTDANGRASFADLKAGLYLITTGSVPGYLDMAPYMLLLPVSADGKEWVYDVFAEPKTEIVPVTSPATSNSTSTTATSSSTWGKSSSTPERDVQVTIPKTGINNMWSALLITVAAIFLFAIGWILFQKFRVERHTKQQ